MYYTGDDVSQIVRYRSAPMAKRRTSGIQRRARGSEAASSRRVEAPGGMSLPDWRLLFLGGVLAVGAAILVLVTLLGSPPSPNAGTQQPLDDGPHVTNGASCRANPASCQASADPYSSLPATSGPHWGSPNNWGVYTTPQNESQLIHNMEHGGVIVWYDPDRVDADGVSDLANYVTTQVSSGISGRYKFILSPWSGEVELRTPVAVTAWRQLLELDAVDTSAIDEFARAHYGRSPEPNGGPAPRA